MKTNAENIKATVCIIGAFPPPLHGMSLINSFIIEQLKDICHVQVLNTSRSIFSRSFYSHIYKLCRFCNSSLKMLCSLIFGNIDCIYIAISAGYGQLYDLAFVTLARVFSKKIFIHHHSYRYIYEPNLIAKFLFFISGSNATHIVSCDKMKNELLSLYSIVKSVRVLSGICSIMPEKVPCRHRQGIKTIGFMSNICEQKGIIEFLQMCEYIHSRHNHINFLLAGPFQNEDIKKYVMGKLGRMPYVTYLGPVYGYQKINFFDTIDLFIFPSHDESEGLVIHESFRSGVPVVAYDRGCICNLITNKNGFVVNFNDDFLESSYPKILEWILNPNKYESASNSAYSTFCANKTIAVKELSDLLKKIRVLGS